MEIKELEQLINDIPRKWGSSGRAKGKQAIVNKEMLKLILQLQKDTAKRPVGRPRRENKQ